MYDKNIKPFIKWAGGKRQLIPAIEEYIPRQYNQYYEPFIGAGALFLHIQPSKAIINDYNGQLIMAYLAIKNDIENLIALLKQHKQYNSKDYFYQIRSLDNAAEYSFLSDTQKAARLIYLNKTCYNGLYRVNSKGFFNVPYANYKNPAILDELTLRAISKYLNNNDINISEGDFSKAVQSAKTDDFVYFDPPYHSENNNFTSYQSGGFDEAEQQRLKKVFDDLSHKGVKVLLSNSDTKFIRDLYCNYDTIIVQAKRHINSNAQKRGYINELLVKNY